MASSMRCWWNSTYVRLAGIAIVAFLWMQHALMPGLLFLGKNAPQQMTQPLEPAGLHSVSYECVFFLTAVALSICLVPPRIIRLGGLTRWVVGTLMAGAIGYAIHEVWMAMVGNSSTGLTRIYATLWYGGRALLLLLAVLAVRVMTTWEKQSCS